jgi:hypothetical protein
MRFPLQLAGKRRVLPMKQTPHWEETAEVKTATAMSFLHGSGLLFLKDSHSKLSFLVDSGARLSILPCSSCSSGDSSPRSGLSDEVPAVHPPPASTGIGQRPKAAHINVRRRRDNITTNGKTDLTSQVRRPSHQLGPSLATKGGKEGLRQQHRGRLTCRQHTTAGGKKMPSRNQ